jgi:hypothetical protein
MPKRIESNSNIICNQTPKENFIKYKHYLQSYTQGGIESNTSIICNQTPQGQLGIQSYQQSDAQEFESEIICNQTSQGTGIELNSTLSAITQKPENSKEPVTLFSSQNSVTRIYTDFLNVQNSLLSLDWKWW